MYVFYYEVREILRVTTSRNDEVIYYLKDRQNDL